MTLNLTTRRGIRGLSVIVAAGLILSIAPPGGTAAADERKPAEVPQVTADAVAATDPADEAAALLAYARSEADYDRRLLESEMANRRIAGFNAERDYVLSLRGSAADVGTGKYGIPLTEEELAELERRVAIQTLADESLVEAAMATVVRRYGRRTTAAVSEY